MEVNNRLSLVLSLHLKSVHACVCVFLELFFRVCIMSLCVEWAAPTGVPSLPLASVEGDGDSFIHYRQWRLNWIWLKADLSPRFWSAWVAEGILGNGGDSKFDKQMNGEKNLKQLVLVVAVGLMSSDQPLRTTNHILLVFWAPQSPSQNRKSQIVINKRDRGTEGEKEKTYAICIMSQFKWE